MMTFGDLKNVVSASSPDMLQNIRERLSLVLLFLLPLHAFLVTVFTKLFKGVGSAPMTELTLWKEALLFLIVLISFIEIIKNSRRNIFLADRIDALIISLFLLAAAITLFVRSDVAHIMYGIKYDFLAILSFLILRRVVWTEGFLEKAFRTILFSAVIVCLFGLLTYFLPESFFTTLGYSNLHSLYRPDNSLAAFQHLPNGLRRLQATLSGPNQFGLWLLLPWSIALYSLQKDWNNWMFRLSAALIFSSIILTFSRSAWISTFVITLYFAQGLFKKNIHWKTFLKKKSILFALSSLSIILLVGIFLGKDILLRSNSTKEHFFRPLRALQSMIDAPLGRGLGTAGPATNRLSDTCVYLEAGSDISWTDSLPELCVFVGETQVRPAHRVCDCPFLPENWYLQIGVELGFIGMLIFTALIFIVLSSIQKQPVLFASFLGISIAALFLHAWEDSAIAYSIWLLVGAFTSGKMPGTR